MSDSVQQQWIERLRDEFDRSFQRAHAAEPADSIEALSIRVGHEQQTHLIRVDEAVSLLQRMPAIRPLPGAADTVLGLALLRGRVVPVYCLARLLAQAPDEAPEWLIGIGGQLDYALAFAELKSLRRIKADALSSDAAQPSPHLRQVLIETEHSVPLINIPSITSVLERPQSARSAGSHQHA